MTNRAGRLRRGLSGLVGLAALVVGLPVGLTAAGEGPGIHFGGLRAFHDGLFRPVSDSTLVRVAALACWLVWLLFVAAIVIEILAAVSSGAGRARANVRIPALQGVANALLLSALLLLPQRGIATAGAATRRSTAFSAAAPVAARLRPETPEAPVSRLVSQPSADRSVRYVVRRYDSPWGIAERHLGDGTRWRELRDEHGRSLSMATGPNNPAAAGQHPQARIIRPGDVLFLPDGAPHAGATPTAAHTTGAPRPAPTTHVERAPAAAPVLPTALAAPGPAVPIASMAAAPVPADPSLTPLAPSPGNQADAAPPAMTAVGAPSPGSTTDAPPGLSTPRGDQQSPMRSTAPVPKADSAAVSNPSTGDAPPVIVNIKTGRHARETTSTTLIEAGLLSGGVLATLLLLRRRQAQHRPAGRRLRLPGRDLAGTELAVWIGAQPEQADRIDRAVRRLVADLQQSQLTVPSVLAIVAGSSFLEVLVDRPLPPPAPWTSAAEGFRWRVATAQLTPTPSQESAPLPGLVPIGRAGPDGPEVLLNLEAAGVLSVTGDTESADGLIRALATSLSGLSWAHAVNLILVGFGGELESVANVRAVGSIASVLGELRSTAKLMREAIGDADPFAARVSRPGGDGWAPTVVCCAGSVDPADQAQLAGLAKPGTGVIAVVHGRSEPTAWTVDVDSSPITVQPLRLAVEPTLLPVEDLEQIGDLYRLAMDESGSGSDEPPYSDLEISADRPPPTLAERLGGVERPAADTPSPAVEGPIVALNGNGGAGRPLRPAAHPIWVSILGTVEIEGAGVFKRAKSREVAVYLALHPNGVGEAELDEALWPSGGGRLVAPSTRDSTVSVARTALGGPSRLLPAQGHGREKRYQVSADVGTDWSLFCQFHREGRAARDAGLLREALRLVRGRPFEGVIAGRTYGWVHTEGHARHIEAEVADAADLAASLLLAAGDALEARWAARQGLLADPYVERLWVELMEGADQLGDSQEIERIMDEMDVVLELEGDFSGLHPHTLQAYDRLSRRRRVPR